MKQITKQQQTITNDHHEDHQYVYEDQAKEAVNAALLINRPLLILGEPGIGKSQLAKAVACELGRTYIPYMIDANTEAQDLLWTFDAVARLAEAQIEGALCKTEEARKEARELLQVKNFIKPAPLWMSLNWCSAEDQYKTLQESTKNKDIQNPMHNYLNADKAEENGVVLLIDEIDKANSSVPNGLLEVLGSNRFHPDGFAEAIKGNKEENKEENNAKQPLIIITTNQERTLPNAFLRRCLTVTLGLPKGTQNQIDYLVKHAVPNFPKLNVGLEEDNSSQETILQAAAKMVIEDRKQAKNNNLKPLPGQAEYFDLLRGINKTMILEGKKNIRDSIRNLSQFTSKKHPKFDSK